MVRIAESTKYKVRIRYYKILSWNTAVCNVQWANSSQQLLQIIKNNHKNNLTDIYSTQPTLTAANLLETGGTKKAHIQQYTYYNIENYLVKG